MLTSDEKFENTLMDNEARWQKYMNEEELEKQFTACWVSMDTAKAQDPADWEVDTAQLMREQNLLLGCTNEMIHYACKLQDIPVESVTKKKSINMIHDDQKHITIGHRVAMIIERYQEMPNILDKVLEPFVTPLMTFIKVWVHKKVAAQDYEITPEITALFAILISMVKTRGQKTVVKFFPHEVADMEPACEMLHFQSSTEYHVPYTLILWLSIIVMVPFDLTTIDSQKGKDRETLVKRILNIGRTHLMEGGKVIDASILMTAKLLTRPDVVKQGLLDQALIELADGYKENVEKTDKLHYVTGCVKTIVEIYKTGHRDDLMPRVGHIFDPILKHEVQNKFNKKSSHLKKARVNLAQRIGCIFLKPRVAKWRYQRGARSLAANLSGVAAASGIITSADSVPKKVEAKKEDDEEEDDDDDEMTDEHYDQLEHIIDYLLQSLNDDDNVVRWTAAKGIGRITMRLSADFADQIVQQLFDLFQNHDNESAWHGGCLALAELCRRGLLLPERLDSFVPILSQALIYDINLGNHSVGTHVRDAACYVVWSFARAYDAAIMKPHVETLSNRLIVVSLFDREVNIRRAASATFQECVGRQGTFPHGIDILTEADYFTLSSRVNAYLNVSCHVGQFKEYLPAMLNHLAFVQLRHWDPAMRELSAQALSVLCVFDPELVVKEYLPKLIETCFSKTLHLRHGAILGVSEILIGMSGNSVGHRQKVLEKAFKSLSLKQRAIIKEETLNQKQFKAMYDELSAKNQLSSCVPVKSDIYNQVVTLCSEIEKKGLYKGKGGEIMRTGVCHLIHSISQAGMTLETAELQQFYNIIKENLKHPNVEIQEEATFAFQSYCQNYFKEGSGAEGIDIVNEVRQLLKASGADDNISIARGYNMAFGALSSHLLTDDAFRTEIIQCLLQNSLPKGKETDDADTRKQAIKSVNQIVSTIGLSNLTLKLRAQILETLYKAINDYQLDRRGDVGSWVREEAMRSLTNFVCQLKSDMDLMTIMGMSESQFLENYISLMLQQLVEKIDRVREVAGRQLQTFFKFYASELCAFADKDALIALFTQEISEEVEDEWGGAAATILHDDGIAFLPWRSAEFVFDQIQPFFDSEAYSLHILKGLITSSGGLTESTLKASQKALFRYLSTMKNQVERKKVFVKKLVTIFAQNEKDDRITIPLMKTVEIILQSDYLNESELAENDLKEVHAAVVKECSKSKNILKLMAAVGVFACLLVTEDKELVGKALRSLLFLLYHTFPKVRKTTAEKLYTSLLSMEDYSILIPGEDEDAIEASYEAAIEMLSETDWSSPQRATVEATKVVFYGYFGQEVKVAVKATPAATMQEAK